MIHPEVLNLMIEQGGAFNRQLAELYEIADSRNKQILECSFEHLFFQFAVLFEPSHHEEENDMAEYDRILEDLLCSFDDNF